MILVCAVASAATAAQADEAEDVFAEKRDEIVLLFTDVVMPGHSGPALYQSLAAECPSLKVLYMSGYSDVASHRGGMLTPDSPFIAKPFTTEQLAQKVREVLAQ